MRELLQHPMINIISLSLAIAGIVLAYIFYRKGRRFKEPCWASWGRVVLRELDSAVGDIRVLFQGKEVKTISVDRIVFWNNGRETISNSDLVSEDPLRIECVGDGTLLDATILAANNPPSRIGIALSSDARQARIEYAYLDEGHGAVFQLINTSTKRLVVRGVIKGVTRLREKKLHPVSALPLPTTSSFDRRLGPRRRRMIMRLASSVFAFATAAVLMYVVLRPPDKRSWPTVILAVVYLLAALFWAARYWASALPSGLEAYEDDLPASQN